MFKCKIPGLIAVVLFGCSSMSYGALILDQACEDMGALGSGVGQDLWVWQEFRPAMDNLEQVDFFLENGNGMVPSTVTVSFQIRDGGTVLWGTSFSADLVSYGWFEIDTPQISLVPDHSYRLYLTSDLTFEQMLELQTDLIWSSVENDPYSRGISSWGSDIDYNFRTWAVPEPMTIALLAFGGLAVLRKRRGESS